MTQDTTVSQRIDDLTELKAQRVAALREYVRLDAAIRAANEQFPPQGEWQTHTYKCSCGGEFLAFVERTLHVLEHDNYLDHHPAENPPRKVRCNHCFQLFIAQIPADHKSVCKPKLQVVIDKGGRGKANILDFSEVE